MAEHSEWDMPLLEQRGDGGLGSSFARLMAGRHPVFVFFSATIAGLLALWAASIALGFLVVDGLLSIGDVRSADEELPRWLADNRSATLTDISAVGSQVGGGIVLPIVVALVGLWFATRRQWLPAAFAIVVLMVESATYRVTTIVHPRGRPEVMRLEELPIDASYPSGHTAAAVAVYAGLVLLITSRFRSARLRVALWIAAITLAVLVALSRMYRGMHHPIDALAGVLIGIGAIVALIFACRAAHACATQRAPERGDGAVAPLKSETAT